jgi:hypothetical protein
MRKVLLAILGLTVLPSLALAQESCFTCILGIYADLNMTQVTGLLPTGTPTDVFLGIKLDPNTAYSGITGVEFSVAGIGGNVILAGTDPVTPATITVGSPPAPADTTEGSSGTGGMNVSWPSCLAGSQALVKLTLLAISPVTDKVLQVKHKYPVSNPTWKTPIVTLCDAPAYTVVRVTEACFVANPSSAPPACAIGVQEASWSGIKALYK